MVVRDLEHEHGNNCPVCGQETAEDEVMIYCENCGFSVRKKEEDTPPTPA